MTGFPPKNHFQRRVDSLLGGFAVPRFDFPSIPTLGFSASVSRFAADWQPRQGFSGVKASLYLATALRRFSFSLPKLPHIDVPKFGFGSQSMRRAFAAAAIALLVPSATGLDQWPTPTSPRAEPSAMNVTARPLAPLASPRVEPVVIDVATKPAAKTAHLAAGGEQTGEATSLTRCLDAANSIAPDVIESGKDTKLRDAFVAAWTASCHVSKENDRLGTIQANDMPTVEDGTWVAERAYELGLAEIDLVRQAPRGSQEVVRRAVRIVGDRTRTYAKTDIDSIALAIAQAAQKPDARLNTARTFSHVVFLPQVGPKNITLPYAELLANAQLCQNEADQITASTPGLSPFVAKNIGTMNCVAVNMARRASGQFGDFSSFLNAANYEAIQSHGLSGMFGATADSIAAAQYVVQSATTRFGGATFFFDGPVVNDRGSSRWIPATMVGVVGKPGVSWYEHEYHVGIIKGDTLEIYQPPSYKVTVTYGGAHRPQLAQASLRPAPHY